MVVVCLCVCVHQNIHGGRVRLQSIVTVLTEFNYYEKGRPGPGATCCQRGSCTPCGKTHRSTDLDSRETGGQVLHAVSEGAVHHLGRHTVEDLVSDKESAVYEHEFYPSVWSVERGVWRNQGESTKGVSHFDGALG